MITNEIYYPPDNISYRNRNSKSIFLAGTIDNNNSIDWQQNIINELKFHKDFYYIFNPRRKDWDSSWLPEFSNPNFYQQVNWELNALDNADIIIMYFLPDSKSPISLLELGLYATSGKLRVVCPDGFYRKGNVDIVCNKYNIPMYGDIDDLIREL